MIYRRFALPILLAFSLTLLPSGLAAQTVGEWFQRGNAAHAAGRYREAEEIWRRVLEMEPNNAAAYNNLGIALRNQGKLPEAIDAYRRAIALDPNYAIAYNNLGFALRDQGKLPEAIDAFRRALALDPNFAAVRNNLRGAERLLTQQNLPATPREILPSLEQEPLFGLQRSTVQIFTQTSTGFSRGTGWVVHREGPTAYIITNRHVVSDEQFGKRPSSDIEIELYSHNEPEHRLRLPARIRHITNPNDILDLAILEVTDLPEDIQPLELASEPVPLNQDILMIGHPVTGNPWTILRGYIAANTSSPDHLNLQIGGTNLAVGVGGSPVLYNNQVVGLVANISDGTQAAALTGGDPGVSIGGGFGFAYPIDIIRQQLQRWGMEF